MSKKCRLAARDILREARWLLRDSTTEAALSRAREVVQLATRAQRTCGASVPVLVRATGRDILREARRRLAAAKRFHRLGRRG